VVALDEGAGGGGRVGNDCAHTSMGPSVADKMLAATPSEAARKPERSHCVDCGNSPLRAGR